MIKWIALFLVTTSAFADCRKEFKTLCPEANGVNEVVTCVLRKEDQVSTNCKQDLQRIAAFVKSAGSRGGGGISSFGGVMGNSGLLPTDRKTLSYSVNHAPEGTPASITQQRLSFSTPVWKHKAESFAFSTGVGSISFSDRKFYNKSLQQTPSELKRVELGGQYSRRLKEGKALGFRANVGSASDRVFNSLEEVTFSLNGTYSFPGKDPSDHWIWTVFFSNNISFANYIPLPGFIYLHKTENFTGMFGLPFLSMQWTPVKPIVLSMSYFITNLNTEIAYGFNDTVQAFMGFAINQQAFLRADRTRLRDRMFFNEKKLFVGMRSPIMTVFTGEFQLGRSFDRKLTEGRNFSDSDLEADLGKSWYGSASINLSF
jgi:hypothetical protein